MIKKITCTILLAITFLTGFAQNPVSYPPDTTISKPELNFEVLWRTFEDNYAFFKLRNIDWHKSYDIYRPQVNDNTSPDSLYSIFCKMLALFHDNHINLIVPGVKQFKSIKPSQFVKEFPTDSLCDAFQEMTFQFLQKNHFQPIRYIGPKLNNKSLFAYTVTANNKMGYLSFNRCFVDGNADNVPDAVVAGKILDTVFEAFRDVKSLIIDVRDNMGGNDEFAYEVAGRFSSTKFLGMYKQTRKRGAGYEDFGSIETWYIEPKGKKHFTKPVVVLTSDKTVSAADVFSMIMKELPQVKIVGSNSRGIYSDMYGFTLPNGWLVSLSNQRYYNNKMVCYEVVGTPVDIQILNTRNDLIQQIDPVLKLAMDILSPANKMDK